MSIKRIDIKSLVRKNILELQSYASARSEYKGKASVFLDANENAFGSPLTENYHRYPDPLQVALKEKLAFLNNVSTENICIGNGSDELIDYLIRIFCIPGTDAIVVCPPTFRMYDVAASINDVQVKRIMLTNDFQPDTGKILQEASPQTKILFLCSPNNPTGNDMKYEDIEKLLAGFPGIVVVDEAYINYSGQASLVNLIATHNNLVVLQTLSKAWGLAALRVGIAYAGSEIIRLMTSIKMPYNVNSVSQSLAIEALEHLDMIEQWKNEIVEERLRMAEALTQFDFIRKVFPSNANFILIRAEDGRHLYSHLAAKGIIVRNQSSQPMLENCLRITIGTRDENTSLIEALKTYAE